MVLLGHNLLWLNRPIYRQISILSTIGLSRPINTLLLHRFQFSMLRRLTLINTVVLLRHLLIKRNRPIYRQISKLSTTDLGWPTNTLSLYRFQFCSQKIYLNLPVSITNNLKKKGFILKKKAFSMSRP